jgi:hypothetical protein
MRRRAPRPLTIALDRITGDLMPATLIAEVQRAWAAAAGDPFGRLCAPVSERDGVVRIACGSAVVAQELDLMGELVVARLNAALGRTAVRGLRPTAQPIQSPPP